MPKHPVFAALNINVFPKKSLNKCWIHLIEDGVGHPVLVPVIILRGQNNGPIVGLTAAIHGNELNGVKVIQKLLADIDVSELRGTIVGIPMVNVPAVLRYQRRYTDEEDLNRIMPGYSMGNESQVYAHRFIEKIARHFHYLVDLHTASFGRVNSYYIRASLHDSEVRKMAMLQNAQIVLDSEGGFGTFREAATNLGIHAITVEVGDPNKFQKGMIRSSMTGIFNLFFYLNMLEGEIEAPLTPTIVCSHSQWYYTDHGGVLEVFPNVAQEVKKGESIAIIRDAFGEGIKSYYAPKDGVVIGKSVEPICPTGGRILHLGVVKEHPPETSLKPTPRK
ncbi:succinylglutamate desuccinylase/aspartoacylase family protein [Xanthovirga aplysinae]|uniref:succinylglutamate desuccinylase/aspartoacylase family protein n=1 Tax=Xanthovirga aplysinae TaxID=2529853 RepID=UPI0012BBCBFB|nr:succinylglutamate desuccinylase/aspartoacylase family protein [Xanthovirga aplysinae]MTI33221.1 succinylglutamate desuccinylase/aspartoacylase family protein [Xanthovirga aplysinae]